MLEEAAEPFVEDMKRHLGLGLDEEAFEICKGIVLGRYECRNENGDEFLDWAADFPVEAAGAALTDWIGTGQEVASGDRLDPNRVVLLQKFVDKYVPEWQWISKQVVGREDE